ASRTPATGRIPNPDAARATPGTFDGARISESSVTQHAAALEIDADQVTSGTLDDARIPGLDASKITSGTLPIARGGTGLSAVGAPGAPLVVNQAGDGLEFGVMPVVHKVQQVGVLMEVSTNSVSLEADTTVLWVQRSSPGSSAGITQITAGVDGRVLFLYWAETSGNLTLSESSGTSPNRIRVPGAATN